MDRKFYLVGVVFLLFLGGCFGDPAEKKGPDSSTSAEADSQPEPESEEDSVAEEAAEIAVRSGPTLAKATDTATRTDPFCESALQIWEEGSCRDRRCDRPSDGISCDAGSFCNSEGRCVAHPECFLTTERGEGARLVFQEVTRDSVELKLVVEGLTDEAERYLLLQAPLDDSGRPIVYSVSSETEEQLTRICLNEGECPICTGHPENCPGFNPGDFSLGMMKREPRVVRLNLPGGPFSGSMTYALSFPAARIKGRLVTRCGDELVLGDLKTEAADFPDFEQFKVRLAEERNAAEIEAILGPAVTDSSILCLGESGRNYPVQEREGVSNHYFCEPKEEFTTIKGIVRGHAGLQEEIRYCLQIGGGLEEGDGMVVDCLDGDGNIDCQNYDHYDGELKFFWSARQRYRVKKMAIGGCDRDLFDQENTARKKSSQKTISGGEEFYEGTTGRFLECYFFGESSCPASHQTTPVRDSAAAPSCRQDSLKGVGEFCVQPIGVAKNSPFQQETTQGWGLDTQVQGEEFVYQGHDCDSRQLVCRTKFAESGSNNRFGWVASEPFETRYRSEFELNSDRVEYPLREDLVYPRHLLPLPLSLLGDSETLEIGLTSPGDWLSGYGLRGSPSLGFYGVRIGWTASHIKSIQVSCMVNSYFEYERDRETFESNHLRPCIEVGSDGETDFIENQYGPYEGDLIVRPVNYRDASGNFYLSNEYLIIATGLDDVIHRVRIKICYDFYLALVGYDSEEGEYDLREVEGCGFER